MSRLAHTVLETGYVTLDDALHLAAAMDDPPGLLRQFAHPVAIDEA